MRVSIVKLAGLFQVLSATLVGSSASWGCDLARYHRQKTKVVLKLALQVRQNVRVKMTTIVNSSKRPSNMASVQIQV